MTTIRIDQAETHLSELIARANAGEEIVIVQNGSPVARLVPIPAAKPKRRFGAMKGKVAVGPEFFDPLPEDELDAWE